MEKLGRVKPNAEETLNITVDSVLRERIRPVIKETNQGCWILTARKNGHKRYPCYRIVYRLFRGDFDDSLNLLHSCDNPPCINPAHLRPGTQRENIIDMQKKGRAKLGNQKYERKLSKSDVASIRAKYKKGITEEEFKSLAKKYNVNCWYLREVARGNQRKKG